MSKLDLTDRKILYELDINARVPVSILAKKLKLSRDVVNYRIKKLEKDSVIRGYHAFIDASKLGYGIFRVYFKFYSINKAQHDELIKVLIENNNVFWVGETDGFIDIAFGVWAKTSKDFDDFYKPIIERFRLVVKHEYVNEVVSYSYLDRIYLIGKKPLERHELIIGGNKEEKYDNVDIKILKILSQNARTQLIEIADKLKMDSASVIYRIRQLEKKKIILGYKVDLNFHLINRYFYTVKMYLSDFKNKKQLISYLKSLPFVTNFTEAIGSWDVEVDLEVESDEEYHNSINDLKGKFEFISEISFFRAPKTYKIINMPS